MKDVFGNEIQEKSQVVFTLSDGEMVPGEVVRVNSGLSLADGAPAQPSLVIAAFFHRPALPNGLVPGVIVPAKPQTTSVTEG
jgi:hypothetical protein